MWVGIFTGLGGLVVGYMIGVTRASIAAQRDMDQLQDRIDAQMIEKRYGGMLHFHRPTGPRPPLAGDE